MRLGDLDALKKAFSNNCGHNCYYCNLAKWDKKGACYNCGLIDNAPTVDALKDITEVHCDITKEQLLNSLRPQGEWISQDYDDLKISDYRCNQCGHYQDDITNFCPNCGAEMQKPNCVTCDHFGKCDGCEKRDEE